MIKSESEKSGTILHLPLMHTKIYTIVYIKMNVVEPQSWDTEGLYVHNILKVYAQSLNDFTVRLNTLDDHV